MIEKRGRLDDQDVDRFIAAGFGKDHALEVVAIVAAPTMTNYTGRITKTPVSLGHPVRSGAAPDSIAANAAWYAAHVPFTLLKNGSSRSPANTRAERPTDHPAE